MLVKALRLRYLGHRIPVDVLRQETPIVGELTYEPHLHGRSMTAMLMPLAGSTEPLVQLYSCRIKIEKRGVLTLLEIGSVTPKNPCGERATAPLPPFQTLKEKKMQVESYRGQTGHKAITTLIVPAGTDPMTLPKDVLDHLGLPLIQNKTYNLESTQPIIGVDASEAHAALLKQGYYVAKTMITTTTTIGGKQVE